MTTHWKVPLTCLSQLRSRLVRRPHRPQGVIAHLRRTVVRPGLDVYVSVDCANDEVGRRLQDTLEAAFIPLFERSWRTAFPELRTMLPACTDPQEVVLVINSLLPRVNMQGDFTDANLVAFCKVIRPYLPNVASAAVTSEGQDARIEQLMASVRTEINLPGATGLRREMKRSACGIVQKNRFPGPQQGS